MKTYKGLFVFLAIFLVHEIALAQQRTWVLPPEAQTEVQRLLAQTQFKKWIAFDGGAWWTNTTLVSRLGLTDDQKTKVERAFENHRVDLSTKTDLLNKEEAQLTRLLEAETVDRNAVFTQIDRVIQARGELERANAAMTLEMREALTRAQWMQLPQQQPFTVGLSAIRLQPPAQGQGQRGGQRSGGGRGQPQQ